MPQNVRFGSNWAHIVAEQLNVKVSDIEQRVIDLCTDSIADPRTPSKNLKKLGSDTVKGFFRGTRSTRPSNQSEIEGYVTYFANELLKKGAIDKNTKIASLTDYLNEVKFSVVGTPMSLNSGYTDPDRRIQMNSRYPGVYHAYRKLSGRDAFRRDILILHPLHRSQFAATLVTSYNDGSESFGVYHGFLYANNRILYINLMRSAQDLRFDVAVFYLNQVMTGPVDVLDGILLGTTDVGSSPMATPVILRRANKLEKRVKSLEAHHCNEGTLRALVEIHNFDVANSDLDTKQKGILQDHDIVSVGIDKACQVFSRLDDTGAYKAARQKRPKK